MIERKAIENTPFIMVHTNNKWFITLAQYKLTEPQETEEEALKEIEENKWNNILTIIAIIIDKDKEITARNQIEMEFGKDKKNNPA